MKRIDLADGGARPDLAEHLLSVLVAEVLLLVAGAIKRTHS